MHLNYRNDCVIISRALISSPQRGYMVHASRASTASAPAPFSARHFLIGRSAIKNARNSPEINALDFSNRPIKACLRAPFPRVSRPKYHHLPETYRGSLITNHQSLLTNHAFLFNTNKAQKNIIRMRAPLKTKDKQFSIQYKFAYRDTGTIGSCRGGSRTRPYDQRWAWRRGKVGEQPSRVHSFSRKQPVRTVMKRLNFAFCVAAFCVVFACGRASAQKPVWQPSPGHTQIPIWPGVEPDAQPAADPEYVATDTDSPVAGRPWLYVANVTQPTMTVYSPEGKNTGAAVVVFPGGGYQILAIDLEGTEVCDWLTSKGITCVLLKYRVPNSGMHWDERCECQVSPKSPTALEDAQRTIGLVRLHAAEWRIDPHKIGVLGFSAGGHLAVAISTHFEHRLYPPVDAADKESCRPDFAVALYPGHLWIDEKSSSSTRIFVLISRAKHRQRSYCRQIMTRWTV